VNAGDDAAVRARARGAEVSAGGGRFSEAALPFLRCPLCHAAFSATGRSLRCVNGHSYDVAHQGYVNLLPGGARPGTADTAEMVAARETFLAGGHFAELAAFVCETAERALAGLETASQRGAAQSAGPGWTPAKDVPGCVVEVGAGTGYYLAGLLDRLPGRIGLALDISKYAARRAARAHERMAAVVCDVWEELPMADESASLVLDIFAPRNPAEFHRLLRPEGILLVVTPGPDHLRELVARLGLLCVDERKPERLEQALGGRFALCEQAGYEEHLTLPPSVAGALAAMGPSAHHLQAEQLAHRLSAVGDAVEVTLSVTAAVYTPRRS
jgi:23S rRNA (guanine745-N1)-methyltransferase